MNLVGAVDASAFDAAQPSCRRTGAWLDGADTVLLFGSGGRAAFGEVVDQNGGELQKPTPGYHPIDEWSLAVATAELERLRADGVEGVVVQPDSRPVLNFRQLGEMVGFGTVSPVIGHLLHPEFGPWVSLRVVILLRGRPFGECPPRPTVDFNPCGPCKRPCVKACPAEVYAESSIDLVRCGTHRLEGGCGGGCETLRACPLGAEHRYGSEEEAFRHRYSLFGLQRWFGRGRWKLVPRRWRQR